ncbi:rhodanese-like domain-containing protein [Marivirga sp. S37H4]|uniref:Rhodanese-like domain-containing protein n=1 Tax=Marivirga aurantiaca TaxID=2802615 RepID=A0A934WVC8_9BACT|nr:rhodanese-like domain-containing protein [Marivirga aurantiaca]MBK6263625.1 rhodanese-like domain-containing protein [Marivirga aurantiaca]
MKTFLKILVFSFLQSLMACGQQSYEQKLSSLYKNTVPTISPHELDMLRKQSKVLILDTRSAKEFSISHLEGAEFEDYARFDISKYNEIDKSQPIVVYCSVGYRSERIGEKLQKAGFRNVQNLYGGIFQWKNEGKPVINQQNEKTDSVHTYNKQWGKWLEEDKAIKVYE